MLVDVHISHAHTIAIPEYSPVQILRNAVQITEMEEMHDKQREEYDEVARADMKQRNDDFVMVKCTRHKNIIYMHVFLCLIPP